MGFPENVLTKNEKVVRSIHPHSMTVLGPVCVGLLLTAAAIFASWATPDDTKGNWIQWICIAVAVLLGIPLVIVPFFRWRTTHYVITDHRVMVRRGILAKAGKDITLSKITDVSFQQTFLDRVIRSGTLNIESAGDSADELLKNIPHSDEVQQLVNHLIDQDANRRAERLVDGRRETSTAAEPRAAEPRAGDPRAAEQKAAEQKAGESGAAEPAGEGTAGEKRG